MFVSMVLHRGVSITEPGNETIGWMKLRLKGERGSGELRAFVLLFDLRLDLTTVPGSPLAGQVGQRAMTRSLELTVRHDDPLEYCREGLL